MEINTKSSQNAYEMYLFIIVSNFIKNTESKIEGLTQKWSFLFNLQEMQWLP